MAVFPHRLRTPAAEELPAPRAPRLGSIALALTLAVTVLAGCRAGAVTPAPGRILAVGAESQYADVIAQIGGRFVTATAIMSNPTLDPHAFEASPSIAATVSSAALVVQNGLGYDDFMNRIEAAAASPGRRVIEARRLIGFGRTAANPHIWYRPGTMVAVARAVARALAARLPRRAAYFRRRFVRFERSLAPWAAALRRLRTAHPGLAVATTEPVADDLLSAAGARNVTPFSVQADVMNGIDPAPQSLTALSASLGHRRVRAFVYNVQVVDSVTESLRRRAEQDGIPVVGVYETLPAGYDYQRWMLAETRALERAVSAGVSTEHL